MEEIISAEELIVEIFSYLNVIDLKYARLVCRRWNRIALDYTLPLLTSLERDKELRCLLLFNGYIPECIIPTDKTSYDVNQYALSEYLSKHKYHEVIGYKFGTIVDKIQMYAFKMGNKRIMIKKDKTLYYNVVRLSWLIMKQKNLLE